MELENGEILMITKKNDKLVETSDLEEIREAICAKDSALCWDCQNGYPSKCQKIADLKKGSLDSYDFIKQGFQIIKDEKMEFFIVIDCSNFEYSRNEPKISSDEMRKAKDSLYMYAYDTDDVNIARQKRKLKAKPCFNIGNIDMENIR